MSCGSGITARRRPRPGAATAGYLVERLVFFLDERRTRPQGRVRDAAADAGLLADFGKKGAHVPDPTPAAAANQAANITKRPNGRRVVR